MIENITEKGIDLLMSYGPSFVGAIVVFIIGLWVIRILVRGLTGLMKKRNFEPTLTTFLESLLKVFLRILLIVSILSMIGVQMASFVAIIGAVGLAVALALSGTLQNFAGSMVILIFKTHKVGDYIEIGEHAGVVEEIQMFHTIIFTLDEIHIVIPNGEMSKSTIINYSTNDTKKINFSITVGYGTDMDRVRNIIKEVIAGEDLIQTKEKVKVVVKNLTNDGMVLKLKNARVDKMDLLKAKYSLNENVVKAFVTAGIKIPHRKVDMEIINQAPQQLAV